MFNCELVGLADLRTDTNAVRGRVAGYLNKLIGYGVSGFRVDAAKHIGQTDLDAIYPRLHNTKEGTRPYWALEVFGGGPGASPRGVHPQRLGARPRRRQAAQERVQELPDRRGRQHLDVARLR